MVSTIEDIRLAQVAAQSGTRELLEAQEAKVMTRLVTTFRSGLLSAEEAKVGIGVIAELRSMLSALERTVERGRKAGHSLTSLE